MLRRMPPNSPVRMPSECQSHAVQALLEDLHRSLASNRQGKVADYIPELAKADPEAFGLVMVTADGRVYAVGDADQPFTIQSISKPFAYGLALQLRSKEHMRRKVGVEPSGEAFNAISLDPNSGVPRNPMINAGAIATSAQLQQWAGDEAEPQLLQYFSQLAGRPLQIDAAVYASECETGHRNRAISHLLRHFEVIEAETEAGLDLYFRQCSIQVTCRDLGVMAATLACQGRNPLTDERPLEPETVVQMLSLMGSCGMYDYAGQWLHDVGIPAKSGVGGGILAVIPGQCGIAVYSPALDRFGNSVRGVAACQQLSEQLRLHLYNQNPSGLQAIRRISTGRQCQSRCWRPEADTTALREQGEALRIVHAQGLLAFSATEQLLSNLEQLLPQTRVIVLDLHHVQELPEHCGRLLLRGLEGLAARGLRLVLCRSGHLPAIHQPAQSLHQSWLQCCEDPDLALELAENHLLQTSAPTTASARSLREGIWGQLDAMQQQQLQGFLEPHTYRPGERVIRRGDRGDSLLLVESGRFTTSLEVELAGGQRQTRLATVTAGMCVGEIGFLTEQPRSADVVAEEESRCWVLSAERFEDLCACHPQTGIQLLKALAREQGTRLAKTSYQLAVLEQL